MQHTSLYSQCQRFLATLLLFSLLLQSCGYANLELYNDPPAPTKQGQVTDNASKAHSSKLFGEGGEHPPVELPLQPASAAAALSPTLSPSTSGLPLDLPQGDPAPREVLKDAPSKPAHGVLAATASPPIAGGPAARKQGAPSLEEPNKSSQLLSRVFTTSGGQSVQFHPEGGQWRASLTERPGGPFKELPVACKRHGDIESALLALQAKPSRHARSRIHVLPGQGHHPPMVYLGELGLKGGGNGAGEPSGSDKHMSEAPTGEQEGAQGKEAPIESQTPVAVQEARQELREYYQQPAFAQVKSLFEGEAPKHVDALACELMLMEQSQKQADREGPQTDVSTHHEQLEWVKNPINLEDLFKRRSTKPDEPARAIQRVLLVGEPGTGKTTLSRKLAYRWAQGDWGKEFNAVYVLPVRALQQSQYDNAHMRRDATLATAIANNCFPAQNKDEEYKRLRDQISEELKQPTTLVVLDGLDEGAGASESLLREAKAGSHKLLMLSRPYGIEQERTLVDIEIAHSGLSDGQMQAYVRGNLSPDPGEELLQFIKDYPAIASIAHVPVNLQILCALWRDNQASVRKATSNGSLPGLYRRLTEYIWERYTKQWGLEDADRDELFDTLGKIALEGLEQGQVLISPELVRDHVEVSRVGKMLQDMKDAGFLLLQSVGSQYQFPHLTFQEYFAGRSLAKQLLSSEAKVRSKGEKFFTKHKYEPQYGRMLSFLSGEVSKLGEVSGTRQLLELVNEGPQEVVGVQHLLLQMRLLNEWLCVAGEDCEAALGDLEGDFHVMESLEAWFGEGLKRVRSGNDHNLLELLTSGLQSARSVASHASQVLGPLLAACKDSESLVRSAARSVLEQLVQAAPDKAFKPLLAACKDSESLVRWAASSALEQLGEAAPDKALKPLLAACKDSDWNVRRAASSALGKLVLAAPEQASQVLDPLLAACKDSSSYVRSAASYALGKLVLAAPDKAGQALKPLLAACKDSSYDVRSAASSALGQVAQAAPDKALDPLLVACKDSDWNVRIAASQALGQVAQAAPEQASQVLEPLLAACKDLSSYVRSAASKALGKLVLAAPDKASQVLDLLLAACKDSSSYVRSAASEALGKLGEAAPDKVGQVLKHLLAAYKDSFYDVRSAASSALGQVAQAAPDKALEPLLAACKDSDWNVRIAASQALGKLGEAAPEQASQVLDPLLAACKDSESLVRSTASKALGQVAQAAPDKALEPLLAACKDSSSYVRIAVSKALGKVAQVAPEQASQVLDPLLAACKDSDADVQIAASSALEQLGKAAPEQASQVLDPLLAACKDSEADVRIAASKALGKLGEAAPEQASQVLDPLLAACKDSDWDVQWVSCCVLGHLGKVAPAGQVLDPLLAACKDSSSYVRSAASSALELLGKAAPAGQVLDPLLAACKDSSYGVRSAASKALARLVQAAPDKALEHLLVAYKDSDWNVRRAAISALEQLGKVAPAGQVLDPLLAACKDSKPWVRIAAIWALEQLGEAAPEQASQVLEPLLAACKDSKPWVRIVAISALVQLAQAAPEQASQVLEPLLAACKDSKPWVRIAAIWALVQLAQAAPDRASQVLDPLLAACKDSEYSVRSAASKALGKISLQQLIDTYWATQNQALIPLIAARLYHTPLSVQTIPYSQDQRLILYPTAGQAVKWDKPQQEAQNFVKRIQGAAKQEQDQSQ